MRSNSRQTRRQQWRWWRCVRYSCRFRNAMRVVCSAAGPLIRINVPARILATKSNWIVKIYVNTFLCIDLPSTFFHSVSPFIFIFHCRWLCYTISFHFFIFFHFFAPYSYFHFFLLVPSSFYSLRFNSKGRTLNTCSPVSKCWLEWFLL